MSESHLCHVFDDGQKASGGPRYRINSAALRLIPYQEFRERNTNRNFVNFGNFGDTILN